MSGTQPPSNAAAAIRIPDAVDPAEADDGGADSAEVLPDLADLSHAAAVLDETAKPILTVDKLQMYFPVRSSGLFRRVVGQVQAVDGVSFQVPEGGSLGLVGESGCGKSTTGRLITRLYEPTDGSINFDGREIAGLSNRQLKPLRRDIQMIFQDPYTSLNPRHTVGALVGAPLVIHKVVPKNKVLPRVQELLEIVGLNPEHYNRYPNEFSGGQRQRIGIARALTLQPKLLVADEPVSALDVSIQAQVINLMQDLQREFRIGFLFIAHDLAIVRHFCPEIAVMYLGKIVEIADRDTLYGKPLHPYTQALLSAVPDVKQAAIGGRRERIRLTGDVPSPINPPSGCRFRTRCAFAQEICAKVEPPLLQVGKRHKVACHFAGELGAHPAQPIDATLLGVDDQGNPLPDAPPIQNLPTGPGYETTWFDIKTQTLGATSLTIASRPTANAYVPLPKQPIAQTPSKPRASQAPPEPGPPTAARPTEERVESLEAFASRLRLNPVMGEALVIVLTESATYRFAPSEPDPRMTPIQVLSSAGWAVADSVVRPSSDGSGRREIYFDLRRTRMI